MKLCLKKQTKIPKPKISNGISASFLSSFSESPGHRRLKSACEAEGHCPRMEKPGGRQRFLGQCEGDGDWGHRSSGHRVPGDRCSVGQGCATRVMQGGSERWLCSAADREDTCGQVSSVSGSGRTWVSAVEWPSGGASRLECPLMFHGPCVVAWLPVPDIQGPAYRGALPPVAEEHT